jgi:hypothetical protein
VKPSTIERILEVLDNATQASPEHGYALQDELGYTAELCWRCVTRPPGEGSSVCAPCREVLLAEIPADDRPPPSVRYSVAGCPCALCQPRLAQAFELPYNYVIPAIPLVAPPPPMWMTTTARPATSNEWTVGVERFLTASDIRLEPWQRVVIEQLNAVPSVIARALNGVARAAGDAVASFSRLFIPRLVEGPSVDALVKAWREAGRPVCCSWDLTDLEVLVARSARPPILYRLADPGALWPLLGLFADDRLERLLARQEADARLVEYRRDWRLMRGAPAGSPPQVTGRGDVPMPARRRRPARYSGR